MQKMLQKTWIKWVYYMLWKSTRGIIRDKYGSIEKDTSWQEKERKVEPSKTEADHLQNNWRRKLTTKYWMAMRDP